MFFAISQVLPCLCFQFSHLNPGPRVCFFFSFSTFLSFSHHISRPTVCVSHFPKLSISRHIPGPTVCISHFPTFSVFLSIIQDLQCVSLIFHVFQCYLPYFTSYSVHFSFSTLFSVSLHIPGQTMFESHFSRISFFSPYSRSYNVQFSFSTFFSLSCYILCQTVFVSHFSHYLVF